MHEKVRHNIPKASNCIRKENTNKVVQIQIDAQ